MKLYEKQLKEIIKFVEKHGKVDKVEIVDGRIDAIIPKFPKFNEELSEIRVFDNVKPNTFKLTFRIGLRKDD